MSTQDLRRDTVAVGPPEAGPAAGGVAGAGDRVARRNRRWRRLRRIALWALGVVVVLVLVASGLVVWSVRRAFPQQDGTIAMPGLAAPVTVYRDAYGVPQIYASSETDLFRAQGYVHAQDRFWEMDFRRHLTSGRLAELFGADLVSTDAFLRALGWRQVAEREWQLVSSRTRRDVQAYADGVNAWIADHGGGAASGAKSLEYTVLGLQNSGDRVERWDPVDSLAWLKGMAWEMRGNVGAEIERAALLAAGLTRDRIDELFPAYPFARQRPVVPDGVVRGGAFAADATPGTAAPSGQVLRDAAPALGAVGRAVRSLPGPLGVTRAGIGSNAWAVSGALTASGKPLLANDPHLAPSMPGIWYQVGLHCTCPVNVAGFSLSGIPGVIIGHNARVAWGLTNLAPDVTDLYLEKVDGDRYFDGTGWRDLASRQEVIKVAGGPPVTITVRATRHGPLLSDRWAELFGIAARPPVDASGSPRPSLPPAATPSLDAGAPGVPPPAAAMPYAVALRWTALDPARTIDALFALDTAAGWTDFRAAAALFDVPAQNMVYADVDGNIGYQAPGRIPVRGKGDGRWPAPGWDPAYDWQGYIPFAELPNVLNPPDGVVVSANQAAVGARYPYLITGDWPYGYRSERIRDLLAERAGRGKLGVADTRQIQFDNREGFAPVLVPALLAAPLRAGPTSTVAKARDMLRDWDFREPAQSPARTSAAAAFYNATWRHLLLRTFDELPADYKPGGEERWCEVVRTLLATPASPWWDDRTTAATESMNDILAAAMTDAAAELTDRLGADPAGWRWGALHTLTLENQPFGQSGIAPVEWLFNHGPVGVSGGGGVVNATNWRASAGYEVDIVPSMRMNIDMADLDGSRWVQLSGNSGHAFHANYADQVELWRTGRDTPMRWERSSIEAAARHRLKIEPARPR